MRRGIFKRFKPYYLIHEFLGRFTVTIFGMFLIVLTICLVFFIASKGLSTFFQNHISPFEFLFSKNWNPDRAVTEGGPAVGALIFIVGSILIAAAALLLSSPLSVGLAVFISEISPKLGKKVLQPAIEIFVGIPSVVYGWVGLSLLVPFIRSSFGVLVLACSQVRLYWH